MFAAVHGYSQVVRVLLNKGANVLLATDDDVTALHMSAGAGHLAVTKLLVKAGADLERKCTYFRSTPLYLAAAGEHPEVMKVLIEAGANPNSRAFGGATSLYSAAMLGHVVAIKVLLRAKADALLTGTDPSSGNTGLPLDTAAEKGHLEVAQELIREYGIEGCGGASNGVDALEWAARTNKWRSWAR